MPHFQYSIPSSNSFLSCRAGQQVCTEFQHVQQREQRLNPLFEFRPPQAYIQIQISERFAPRNDVGSAYGIPTIMLLY